MQFTTNTPVFGNGIECNVSSADRVQEYHNELQCALECSIESHAFQYKSSVSSKRNTN